MSEIDNKIRADLFRKRIEDKNTLTGAGAIYVGTGKKTEIPNTKMTVGNAEVTGAYYETVGVAPTAVGQVPVSVSGTGTAGVAGLEFKSVNDAMKNADGSIVIGASNGITLRSGNGITLTNDGTPDFATDISIINRTKNITIIAATGNVAIEGKNQTTISNVSLDTTLNGPLTGNLYTAPSGTPSLSTTGVTNAYSSDTSEKNLVPILYNVGQRLSSAEERLNSLGFKEGSYETTISYGSYGTSTAKIKISKCGRYILLKFIDDFYYFPKFGHQYLITDLPDWAIPTQVEVDPDSGDGMTIGEFSVGAGSNITKATKPAVYLDLYSRIDSDKCALTINVKSHSGSATQPKWEDRDCICLFAGFTFGYNLDEPELEEGSN